MVEAILALKIGPVKRNLDACALVQVFKYMCLFLQVRAQLALWTCGFTMLTLLINAPAIPWLLRVTGLDKISDLRRNLREKARESLMEYTKQLISKFKDKGDETMRGVDWNLVESFAGLGSVQDESEIREENLGGKAVKPGRIRAILKKTRWSMLDSLRKPLISDTAEDAPFDEELGTTAEEKVKAMDRTWAKVGDHESELPFADNMMRSEASIDLLNDNWSPGGSTQDETTPKVNCTNRFGCSLFWRAS